MLNLSNCLPFLKETFKDKSTEKTLIFLTDCKFAFLYNAIKDIADNMKIFFIWLEEKGKFYDFVQARIEIDKFIRLKTVKELLNFSKDFEYTPKTPNKSPISHSKTFRESKTPEPGQSLLKRASTFNEQLPSANSSFSRKNGPTVGERHIDKSESND